MDEQNHTFSRLNAYFDDPHHIIPMIMTVVTVLIILGNILVIAVVYRTKAFANASGMFMTSLACADLGVGVFVSPLSIYPAYINYWPYGHRVCTMAAFFTELFSCISVCSLALIGIDRYLAVSQPLAYKTIMPPERARNVILVKWFLLLLMCLLPVFGVVEVMYYADLYICNVAWELEIGYALGVFILVIIPSFVAVFFCYFHIFRISHKAARQIDQQRDSIRNNVQSKTIGSTSKRKGAMMSFIIIGSFCLCWTPWLALQIQESVVFARSESTGSVISGHPHLPQAHFVTMWLAISNSFFNCVIYFLSNKSFRKGAKRIFRTFGFMVVCKGRKSNRGSEAVIDIWSIAPTHRRGTLVVDNSVVVT
ncbi:G-protein coupled receptor 52-like [Saccoglossus kowalevskii]|uniref:Probable G-protein coupled receptor 52-like n=1 Tax=Saccoglossus kowalevskii TaxID=10224 RepID=A0ABM0M2W8_SACKO|nr:PREDICTED: probable G-protein coupled receptor 52-like [Saccoglossus kowalevskii]